VPWKESCAMQERFKFVMEARKGEKPIAMLCREFGISRTSGYKWLRRYEDEPYPEALDDQSRCPAHSPARTDPFVEDVVVAARKRYPHWGPRKLLDILRKRHRCPIGAWPCAATIGRILKRRGLVRPPKRRVHTPPYTRPFGAVTAPNQLWCVDFKGHFKTLDGTRVYPLTLTDAFSRFILRCEVVLDPRTAEVHDILESAFREYGLPEAIRSDNGAPFASTGPGGLTALSAWWIQLGICHERIDPGKPQQNGRHERMHGTLKYETAVPAAKTPRGQQGRFDRWCKQFNEERPHEGIAMATPASLYVPSARRFPEKLERDLYPFDVERALVDPHGYIRWRGRRVFIGSALSYQLVELRPQRRRRWTVCFGPVVLGRYDQRDKTARLRRISVRKPRSANGTGDALRAFAVDSRRRLPTAKPPPPHTDRVENFARNG
jgi:transposase InsO family protein